MKLANVLISRRIPSSWIYSTVFLTLSNLLGMYWYFHLYCLYCRRQYSNRAQRDANDWTL